MQNKLKGILEIETNPEELIVAHLSKRHIGRVQKKKQRFRRECRLNTQIEGHEINDVMLDLGSDVDISPKKTWEAMGKPKLVYSPI